jgi:hypothetical protein
LKKLRGKAVLALAALALATALAACGDDGDETTAESGTAAELAQVKEYLTDHSAALVEQVGLLQENADEYYELAESVDFDYERLLAEHGDEVEELLGSSKDVFVVANPAYEEMEGIVAPTTTSTSTRARTPRLPKTPSPSASPRPGGSS